jgi:hypothetical protein
VSQKDKEVKKFLKWLKDESNYELVVFIGSSCVESFTTPTSTEVLSAYHASKG